MSTIESIRHVVAVVVTFNTRTLLEECLTALAHQRTPEGTLEIVVVDNGSSDGTDEWLSTLGTSFGGLPLHTVINRDNLGPAKAYNQGVRKALELGADALLLLNSDTVLTPDCLMTLWRHLDASPQVAGVGGPLLNPDGSPQRTRKFIQRILPSWRTHLPHVVTFLGTGYQLTRAGAFVQVGEYDEFYFFYNEDLDWMTRAHRQGLIFHFHPKAKAIHYGGGGRKQNVAPIVRDLYRANAYYFAKFNSPFVVRLALFALRLELRLRIARERRLLRRARGDAASERAHETSIRILREAWENMEAFVRSGGLARAREAGRATHRSGT